MSTPMNNQMGESLNEKLRKSFASIEKYKFDNKSKQSPKKIDLISENETNNQLMVKFKQGL